jgi:hypothetical protein
MAALIALVAVCLFAVGVAAGIIGVVAVAIHREERNLTLTSAAPSQVARAGRWLNGLYVRAPIAPPPATGRRSRSNPRIRPTSHTLNRSPGPPPRQASQGQCRLDLREEANQPVKLFMRVTRKSRT